MKHIIAAGLIGAGVATGAAAQSTVTLYGSLDAGIAYINNVGGHPKWMQEQGNMQPDRWGFRIVEDLGGGLKTVAQLENGFYTNTGNFAKAGTLWNRQAYLGLEQQNVGTLTLGHQTPFSFDMLGPLSTAYLAASWYAFHPGNLDELADTGVVPYDNSVKFRSASFYGFSLGAMMGLGNTTNFSTGRNYGFGLSYANGAFKAAATYSNEHNRNPAIATMGFSTFQGQPAASYVAEKQEVMGAGASYEIGKFVVHGLYTRVKLQSNGQSDTYQTYDAGLTFKPVAWNWIAGGAATTTFAGGRWTQFEIGDIYMLSKSTQLYVNALYEHASGGAKAAFFTAGVSSTANQVIVLAGIHHSF
ncbi:MULTISPECIES: porin [Caballeronia]|uniref:porin n=1 Tax=Caballeronia TaxID=1827195 RepID=UPI0002388439|nr:porin [Caballeronia sp. CLC5]AET93287.1 porin Gram-negative type [Burkholderia sp. YI23]MCE4574348.1 porin [Caballeronia sp. CLC5]BAO89691.1 porin Gram-negative type [Burkholderia sp. RPE67]BBP99730.1 porin [Burkholderia sp. SFA1]